LSFDSRNIITRRAMLFGTMGLLGGLASCQVRPLYSEAKGTRRIMASIGFSDAGSRVGQVVRNRLIFLSAAGQGEPAHPDYIVNLNVSSTTTEVLPVQSTNSMTGGRVVVRGDYTLKKAKEGTVMRIAHRESVALLDYPGQQFAKLRAIRDAENRAANELAEQIAADLAAVLAR
jgi:LPS-assembly lipoprotein